MDLMMVRNRDTLYVDLSLNITQKFFFNMAAHFSGIGNNLDINHCWKSCQVAACNLFQFFQFGCCRIRMEIVARR